MFTVFSYYQSATALMEINKNLSTLALILSSEIFGLREHHIG